MADTETTMVNDRRSAPPPSPRPPGAWDVAVIAIGIGGLLLVLGLPRLIAAMNALDARAVVWAVYTGEPESLAQLASAAAGLEAANAVVPEGEREGDRSLLLLTQADRTPAPADKAPLRDAAEASAVAALRLAPGQPSVWARLASLRERRGDLSGAVAALRLSMLSGSFVPVLMVPRIEQGLRLLPVMDRDTLGLLKRQVRLAWVAQPAMVADLSVRPDAGPLVRDALDELDPAELAQFQRVHGVEHR